MKSKFMLALLPILVFTLSSCRQNTEPIVSEVIPLTEINVAYIAMPMGSPQPLIGREEKLFEDAFAKKGITVNWIITRGINNVIEKMDTEEIDFAYIPLSIMPTYISGKSVFGGGKDSYKVIGGSMNYDFYVVMGGPEIKSLTDLDGKIVGIANDVYLEEFVFLQALEKVGLKTRAVGGTVNVIYHDWQGQMFENLKNGEYDAVVTWTSRIDTVKEYDANLGVIAHLTSDGNLGERYPRTSLIARTELIEKYPDVVREFYQVHVRATERANAERDLIPILAEKTYNDYFEITLKLTDYIKLPTSYYITEFSKASFVSDLDSKYITEASKFLKQAGYMDNNFSDYVVKDL
jgi:ABC-type nitrate/sulfonate/bicarbonate transport system substrate-binding protein